MAALLITPTPTQAEDDSGIPWLGMVIFLNTGGWDCDEPNEGKPMAALKVNQKSGEVPLTIKFDASNSNDPDGYIESYEWSFGDGETATGEKVTHTFSNSGNYDVELKVTDDDSLTDKDYATIRVKSKVNKAPNASFSANPMSGEAPLSVSFDASNSNDSDGDIVSYEWSFGDENNASGKRVNHTFNSSGNYDVKLKVTDNDRLSDTVTKNISVSSAPSEDPVAKFNATPTSGEVPLKVNFDASGSYDPDGSIVSYSWSYENGDLDFGKTTSYTFNSAGTYNVQLQVKDNDNNTDNTTKRINVNEDFNEKPKPNFTVSPNEGVVPLKVRFDASSAVDSDGRIVNYSWGFDDGGTDSGKIVTHTFNSVGNYQVELQVTDNDGAKAMSSIKITVKKPTNKKPTANFTANPKSGSVPLKVNLDASGSNDPDGSIVSYSWDFGDGNVGSGRTTNYTYNNSGTYDVTLTVTDNDGNTDTATTSIKVDSAPPENKNVILSLAQGRPVTYGEWFSLKIDGYGNRGQVDILHNGNVTRVRKSTLGSWRVNISQPSSGRISIEFQNGGNDSNIRGIVKLKMSGNGKSRLELTNAQVFSNKYEMNIMRLIGNTIE